MFCARIKTRCDCNLSRVRCLPRTRLHCCQPFYILIWSSWACLPCLPYPRTQKHSWWLYVGESNDWKSADESLGKTYIYHPHFLINHRCWSLCVYIKGDCPAFEASAKFEIGTHKNETWSVQVWLPDGEWISTKWRDSYNQIRCKREEQNGTRDRKMLG